MFHSARLKLTVFYFGILLVFCLLLSFGVRAFTSHELDRGNDVQRGAFHRLFQQYSDSATDMPPPPTGDQSFATAQQRQADVTRRNLNRDIILIDAGLLAIGALLSYWYAGRTLKPIEEAHEQQKRFTSDASHELRTPLATMRLENEVFLRQKSFNENDAREQLSSNLEEVDRLERLTASLLNMNRLDSTTLTMQPFKLKDAVGMAVDQTKRTPAARQVKFVQHIDTTKVIGEQASVTELVTILLDNAVKYGHETGTVTITGTKQDGHYVLEVRDEGPGISSADLPHVFDRLYRGDKARSSKVSGHGIGLSLAKQIALANQIGLSAANAPKGGAVFRITFATA